MAPAIQQGARITDSIGRTWTVGAQLGRGLWGTSWLLRSDDGRDCVLKTALTSADFPSGTAIPDDLLAIARTCFDEQLTLLTQARTPTLPRLEATVQLEGQPGYVMSRYPSTLKRQLEAGTSIRSILGAVISVVRSLDHTDAVHGNLRPSNVLFNDRGEPVLSDVLTKTAAKHRERLARYIDSAECTPPEAATQPNTGWDTWALCLQLYTAVTTPPSDENGPRSQVRGGLPASGVDKSELVAIKDRTLARLKSEKSNPRFVGRVTDRLASILNRGLSRQHEPSPPFRFQTLRALAARLTEVYDLASPRVEEVGRVMLAAGAHHGVFEGGQPIGFSVTVGASRGITDHEDIVCGVQLRDIDSDGDGRIRLAELSYTVTRHPSGRLRFAFQIPEVPPGRYTVRCAFAIKDAGQEPETTEGRLEVRPPPGYVPPTQSPEEQTAQPIPFARETEGDAAEEAGMAPPSDAGLVDPPEPLAARLGMPEEDDLIDPFSDPSSMSDAGELIEGVFPRPIAPPTRPEMPVAPPPPAGVKLDPGVFQPPPHIPTSPPVALAFGTDSGAPSRPSIHEEVTGPSPTSAQFRPQIQMPTAPSVPEQGWSGPGTWDTLPDPDSVAGVDLSIDPFFAQSMGEELPTWDSARPREPREWLDWMVEQLRKDSYTAIIVGSSLSMATLILLMMTLRACS